METDGVREVAAQLDGKPLDMGYCNDEGKYSCKGYDRATVLFGTCGDQLTREEKARISIIVLLVASAVLVVAGWCWCASYKNKTAKDDTTTKTPEDENISAAVNKDQTIEEIVF